MLLMSVNGMRCVTSHISHCDADTEKHTIHIFQLCVKSLTEHNLLHYRCRMAETVSKTNKFPKEVSHFAFHSVSLGFLLSLFSDRFFQDDIIHWAMVVVNSIVIQDDDKPSTTLLNCSGVTSNEKFSGPRKQQYPLELYEMPKVDATTAMGHRKKQQKLWEKTK